MFLELFDNFMQQDAHEFFNYLLNAISEVLSEERKKDAPISSTLKPNGTLKRSVNSLTNDIK